MKKRSPCKPQSGFTLLELSIVILILSLSVGGIMVVVNQNIRIEKRNELTIKIDRIEAALMDYRIANGRLPCPADLTQLITAANFGVEAANAGTCTGGSPAANFASLAPVGVAGGLPTKTLGLQIEDAFDPWGNRFLYAVDSRITATGNPFNTYPPHDTGSIGMFSILDNNANNVATNTLYVILSHGENGHGAYGRSGIRKSAGSINGQELDNCDCTSGGATGTFDKVFYRYPETDSTTLRNNYDDHTFFKRRQDMLSPSERNRSAP